MEVLCNNIDAGLARPFYGLRIHRIPKLPALAVEPVNQYLTDPNFILAITTRLGGSFDTHRNGAVVSNIDAQAIPTVDHAHTLSLPIGTERLKPWCLIDADRVGRAGLKWFLWFIHELFSFLKGAESQKVFR
jgi:hypothetical protein